MKYREASDLCRVFLRECAMPPAFGEMEYILYIAMTTAAERVSVGK